VNEADDEDRPGDIRAPETGASDAADTDAGSGDSAPEEPGLFGEAGRIPEPVEPGSPTLENAVFVALGVASMIALVVHLFSLL